MTEPAPVTVPSRRIGVAAILISLLAIGCGSTALGAPPVSPAESVTPAGPSAPRSAANTQRSEGGDVTVDATWTGPAAGATFDIKFDTHSVDLDALDLADAVLRNDLGETLTAQPWDAPKGGHHREGVLAFEGDAAGFFGDARWIELVITDVGGLPERVLRWDLAP